MASDMGGRIRLWETEFGGRRPYPSYARGLWLLTAACYDSLQIPVAVTGAQGLMAALGAKGWMDALGDDRFLAARMGAELGTGLAGPLATGSVGHWVGRPSFFYYYL
jgi:hypothetical protein